MGDCGGSGLIKRRNGLTGELLDVWLCTGCEHAECPPNPTPEPASSRQMNRGSDTTATDSAHEKQRSDG